MRFTLPLALLLVASLPAAAAQEPKAPAAKPAAKAQAAQPAAAPAPAAGTLTTEDEKTVYAIGLSIWRSLSQLDLSPAEVALVQRALGDAVAGKPEVTLEEYGPKFEAFGRARTQRAVEKEKARSQAYLDKAAAEPGAVKTESGLIFFDAQPGTGAQPAATDTVKVHYRGTLVDGTEFDSSYKRGEPAQFPLGGVIRCWTEGVQKMKLGGKAKLVCPADIAYGDRGRPGIPGGAALTFEVELIEVVKQEAPAAPAAPPAPPAPPSGPSPAPTPQPK
jgi:FKBP-type peptidyl-prolyl cis-trans isomerase FkpA